MNKIIQGTKNWRPIVGIFGFVDKPENCKRLIEVGKKISDYKGLTMMNFLKPDKIKGDHSYYLEHGQIVESDDNKFDSDILSISQASYPGGLNINTVLLPIDKRLKYAEIIETMIDHGKNVLLYHHGKAVVKNEYKVDIWWKDEQNGNLMALLAYIIKLGTMEEGINAVKVRMIRKLEKGEERNKVENYMKKLITSARLDDELLILDYDNKGIDENIKENSAEASLILTGMPGKDVGDIGKMFSLDKVFFSMELSKFDDLPPVLFVKAAEIMSLIE